MAERRLRGPMRCAVSIAAMALAACAGPSLELQTQPGNARIAVDGEARGIGRTTVSAPYYGTIRVDAFPVETPSDAFADTRRPWRSFAVTMDEPVTPWVFPLDLVIETLTEPWRNRDHRIELETPPPEVLAEGTEPVGLAALSERAAARRRAR